VVVAASSVVTALQTLISRRCPPDVPSILSIGRFIADGATNIIPSSARLEGTFRAMDEGWRERAHGMITHLAKETASVYGAECEVEIRKGYPALNNDEKTTGWVRETAAEYVGVTNVIDLDPWFASEDFAYYAQKIPGTFYRLGTGNVERGITHGLHTPRFTIDEEALRVGPGFMAYLIHQRGVQNS
jgi:hippurate hydrolase